MHSLITRNRFLIWLDANPTPTPPALAAFVQHQPRLLLQPTRPPRAYRVATWLLWVVALLLVVMVSALLFLVFSEEPPQWVRPDLTPAQRVEAFRIRRP